MRGNRGQTSLDFAAGMSTLLLVFAFVLTFVPGILSPFTASGQEETVVADQVADHLAEGLLAERGEPYVLDRTCTVDFLDNTSNPMCRYSGDNLSDRVGISRYDNNDPYRQRVSVQLVADVDSDGVATLLCETSGGVIVEQDECRDGDTILSDGDADPPTETGSVVTARRVVSIGETDATLLVRVW